MAIQKMDCFHDDDSVGIEDEDFSCASGKDKTEVFGVDGGDDESHSSSRPIAQKEDRAVNRSKVMVYLVLLFTASAASVLTYFYINAQDNATFESEFKGFAKELERITEASASSKFSVARSLSITITSYAVDKDLYFPFVTLPDFEIRTEEARALSEAEVIVFIPLVNEAQQEQWEQYAQDHQLWIRLGLDRQGLQIVDPGLVPLKIYNGEDDGNFTVESEHDNDDENDDDNDNKNKDISDRLTGSLGPMWQMGRAPANAGLVNFNTLSDFVFYDLAYNVMTSREALTSPIVNLEYLYKFTFSSNRNTNVTFNIGDGRRILARSLGTLSRPERSKDAHSYILQPVMETLDRGADVIGFLMVVVPWDTYFQNVYPEAVKGVEVVVSDSCGQTYTYKIDGLKGSVKGWGDLHDHTYDDMRVRKPLPTGSSIFDAELVANNRTLCHYVMEIYPTATLEQEYHSEHSIVYAVAVALIFVFTGAVFAIYDYAVQRRQYKVMRTATKTQAIVSSLFPKSVQDRILQDVENKALRDTDRGKGSFLLSSGRDRLTNFLQNGEGIDADGVVKSNPIADLFPFATIVFADIVGFTAWSSSREPPQVFLLLETLYHHFDLMAKRRKVFKVETVGDCYVAVAGLPDPRKDHAVVMARFSADCLVKFKSVVKQMVVTLGPDTEELAIRIGMHSGPVTAGVLRGERARFQLFGDTVNTTARMESTGLPNKIHLSQDTASLLIAAGKSEWVTARKDPVFAKGKGELQTFWLNVFKNFSSLSQTDDDRASTSLEHDTQSTIHMANTPTSIDRKQSRLIDWNVEVLSKSLAQVVARREACQVKPDPPSELEKVEDKANSSHIVLGEVREIIYLPGYDPRAALSEAKPNLDDEVTLQLRNYIQAVAGMYRNNPFHNFDHASHVTMSVSKLLSRIVAPDRQSASTEEALHDHTYGITSDPLTQFSVLLSALIHDVDHPGVPNSTLVKEESSLARVYDNKSVAEQNSVDLAWSLLMEKEYAILRRAIYVTQEDFLRFRALVVNSVMATDIMDKELKNLRNGRWDKAFSEAPTEEDARDVKDRKATIVIEHLIQASDVAHTMQHWHVYQKWNKRFFFENYNAYVSGRSEKDPSEFWYQGEIGFLDFYIIPLAKKLKDCGVFGVTSDEYLIYAEQNRKEWIVKGEAVVAEMLEEVKQSSSSKQPPQPAQEQAPPL
ncbi:hypothetical protein ACA910_012934 [Epithemia clementina (nom. ined.)]